MKIGCLLSVREKATRLPNKVLLDVCGLPLFIFLAKRLARASSIDEVIICTSTHSGDDVLCDLAVKHGLKVFRGSEDDKLNRYFNSMVEFDLDGVVIVDGDDPLCFPELVNDVAMALQKKELDCVFCDGFPVGAASTGITKNAMNKALSLKDESDTEVWGGYFNSGHFETLILKPENEVFRKPNVHLTVDYKEDYIFLTRVLGHLDNKTTFSSHELMELLTNSHPELNAINQDSRRSFQEHLGKSAPVKFRKRMLPEKFLVIGLGSMGRRRVRCLIANGVDRLRIVGNDPIKERMQAAEKDYGITTSSDVSGKTIEEVDAIIISTPPDRHLEYLQMAVDFNKDAFVEASVLSNGLQKICERSEEQGVIIFPSCTMQFFEGPTKIKEIIDNSDIGKVLSYQYQSGQYLPDWHPWEDVVDFYVSKPETGGCREIVPFEMVWIEQVFDRVSVINAMHAKISEMPIEISDIYNLQLKHCSNVFGQISIDVNSRYPVRNMRITGTLGTLEWDDYGKTIKVYTSSNDSWKTLPLELSDNHENYINAEKPYIMELNNFLNCLYSRQKPKYTLENDIRILKVLETAEKSSLSGKNLSL
ncbi:Gfo/Idh/MocA family oxidoreductase [Alphaproteobacteria bacterium]|nr:Gfo/Idh/MocA family oxidoreductase [Alphaproteobacteria bacterium]